MNASTPTVIGTVAHYSLLERLDPAGPGEQQATSVGHALILTVAILLGLGLLALWLATR